MSDEQLIVVERDEERRVALLRFNRSKQLNALNGAVMDALCSALEELDRDEAIRVLGGLLPVNLRNPEVVEHYRRRFPA